MSTDELEFKTVAVLGGSYGGKCTSLVTLNAIPTARSHFSSLNFITLYPLTHLHGPLFIRIDVHFLAAGNRATEVLTAGLPSGWRVVLIDRNS